ncbi:MAPEG family protein [Sphingobium aromaticiconvertens]|uniref:MAPEG family protein n=1 Tax=Sphingobium aromaticiconvertens TaxID=365341 RepID=UPI00301879BD
MLLPITLTLAAASALLNFWLATRCARLRVGEKVLHGDGGNPLLGKRIRAHANFIEYAPITLILFALVELALGASIWLWVAALIFIVGRVGHAFGMDSDKPSIGRMAGILLTWAVMLGMAVTALYAAYTGTRELPAPPALAAHA